MPAPNSPASHGVLKLSWPEPRGYWEVPVLFEDEHLLAIDKPARLLTSPDRYDPKLPNLTTLLHRGVTQGTAWAKERSITYLANAHRLDFETTGVLLLAKSLPVLRSLADQFGAEKPRRIYLAITHGHPAEPAFQVDAKLSQDHRRPEAMRVDRDNGKKSSTRFELVESFSAWSLIRCQPLTERTHQIRVHLKSAGLSIAGDELYGGKPLLLSQLKRRYHAKGDAPEKPLIDSIALHAAELEITHPVTGSQITIEAPLPKQFQVALKYLQRFAGAVQQAG